MAQMRWLLRTAVLLAVVACLSWRTVTAQSIVAVDSGANFVKVVLVQPGKMFDIALSPDSKRKSYSGIGVLDGVRAFGSESFNTYGKKPQNTVWRVRDMLGRSPKDPELVRTLTRNHLTHQQLVEASDGTGALRIEFAKGTKDEATYSPEELFAMILAHCKENGERHGATKVSAVSLTVPMFFNQARRQGMVDAAEIAGLSLLGLVDENAAAAVQYAVDRSFNETVTNMLFFNMGAASTQVSVVQVTGGKEKRSGKEFRSVKVLSKAWDESLGVEDLDLVLASHFAKEFDEKHPSSDNKIVNSARAMVRLKKEGRTIKEILSGLDKFPASFGSLHRDIDFKSMVTRIQMEELAKDTLSRVAAPVQRALKAAGLTISDIHLVEVVGGGFRVPGVKNTLRTVIPESMDLSTHVNGDEGMAFGCAFCAANVSTTFHVPRLVYLQDATPREVRFQLKGEDLERDVQLFARFSLAEAKEPVKQTIKFRHDKDFKVTVFERKAAEDDPQDYPESVSIGEYEVSGMKGAMESFGKFGEPKVHLTFTLDRNLMVSVIGAEARFDEEYEEQVKKPVNATANNDTATASDSTATGTAAEGAEAKSETVKKVRKHVFSLTLKRTDVSVPVKRMTPEAKAQAQSTLRRMDEEDKQRARREEARNSLEAYSFTAREKLDSAEAQVKQVTSTESLEDLKRELAAVEDWIDDHKKALADEFVQERLRLSGKVDRIFYLIKEHEERPAAVKALRSLVRTLEDRRGNWTQERPWISDKVWEVVDKAQSDALRWLDESEAKQKQLSPREDPVLTLAGVRAEMEKIQRMVELLLKQRRPPPVGSTTTTSKQQQEKTASSSSSSSEGDNKGEADAQQEGENAAKDEAPSSDKEEEAKTTADGGEATKEEL